MTLCSHAGECGAKAPRGLKPALQCVLVMLGFCAAARGAAERPLVFPEPDKMEKLAAGFVLDETVPVLAHDLTSGAAAGGGTERPLWRGAADG